MWLARSRDRGATWSDLRVGDTFDMLQAPFANGLFVGDYAALAAIGDRFLPFYARSNAAGSENNRTDVVAVSLALLPKRAPLRSAAQSAAEAQARRAPADFVADHRLRLRVDANLRRRVKWPPEPGAVDRFMPHAGTLALMR